MQHDPLLTQEELAYIHSLLDSSSGPAAKPNFPVDSTPQAQELLATLGEHAQLTLEARIDGQRLEFPLRLVEDESRALHLSLEAPRIYERDNGRIERPWRLHLDRPLKLQDRQGAAAGPLVHELSPNGLLVEYTDGEPAHTFSLWLPLPEQPPLALRGLYVRTLDNGLHAYRLRIRQPEDLKRLYQYIFQQHRQAHPLTDAPAA